jgi:nucleotide-binding universal stress UspA family protein
MLHLETILVPVDFSDTANAALAVAHTLARDHRAALVLMAAVPLLPVVEVPLPDEELVDAIHESQERLTRLAAQITDLPVKTHTLVGEPGAAIVDAAREFGADLIVMGTHGRRGVSRLILGSVAEYVLRNAPCPVLTMKPGTETHVQHDEPTELAVSAAD